MTEEYEGFKVGDFITLKPNHIEIVKEHYPSSGPSSLKEGEVYKILKFNRESDCPLSIQGKERFTTGFGTYYQHVMKVDMDVLDCAWCMSKCKADKPCAFYRVMEI